MIVRVHMLAHHDYTIWSPVIRNVDIPDVPNLASWTDQKMAETVFHYGQNDFQNVPGRCSVSVGDVIEIPDGAKFRLLRVAMSGFEPISSEAMAAYVAMPRSERTLSLLRG